LAKSESDINQQVAIFEASPQVKSANVTKVGLSDTGNTYTFNITLAMNPSIFKPQVTATPVVTTATSTQ
jgi:hypothetical protein